MRTSLGQPLRPQQTLTIQLRASQKLRVDGEDVPCERLHKGDKVAFWIPERTLGVLPNPEATAILMVVIP